MARFEKVNRIEGNIRLPERSTQYSAGYDFFALEDQHIPGKGAITYVKTGVKIRMAEDEFLLLANRSSNPGKKELVRKDNDGEICFAFSSLNETGSFIKKGDKIGQGIIQKFILAEDDFSSNPRAERVGGFGSTDKK